MKQVIIAGKWDDLDTVNDARTSIGGYHGWTPIVAQFMKIYPVATAGTLRNFRVRLTNSAGAPKIPDTGATITFTVRKDAVDTSLSVTITGPNYEAQDLVNEIAFSGGGLVDIACTNSGQGFALYALWSFEFEADAANTSIYFCSGGPWYKNQPAGYATLSPDCSNPQTLSEAEAQQVIAAPGKIKNLYLGLSKAPGVGADAYRLTLRVNGVSTALTVTVSGTSTSGSDLVNEVSVVAGDLVCWYEEPLNVPADSVNARIGFAFEADDAESLFINGYTSALNTGAVRYFPLSHNIRSWDADEYKARQFVQVMKVEKMRFRVSAAPGAGMSWIFTVRKNGADTDLVVTISGTDTTGSDLAHSVTFANDDYVNLSATPSGTPTAAAAYWGAAQVQAQDIVARKGSMVLDQLIYQHTERM